MDYNKLKHFDEEVAMVLIAHEFAHYSLNHFTDKRMHTLEMEDEADQLASEWGFDAEKFRRICCPASCNVAR